MTESATRLLARLALAMATALSATPGLAKVGAYPRMAPRDQYMMDQTAEIALARSAAIADLSKNATVLVLGEHGFEVKVSGTNGFTCLVERSWGKPFDDPEFWNQKMRGPVCMNPAAVRTVLPMIEERTQWALAGVSKEEMAQRSKSSVKARTPPAEGAMSYMMSKKQYLSDDDGHPWHPHVMFYSPRTDGSLWGADLKGSPVLSIPLTSEITMFFIPVGRWSDGTVSDYRPAFARTPASNDHHHHEVADRGRPIDTRNRQLEPFVSRMAPFVD